GWLSGNYADPDPNFVTFGKTSQFVKPGAADTWVLMDENPQTINDGLLAVAIPPSDASGQLDPTQTKLVDWFASSHNRGAGISFADGHSEIHKWLDGRTYTPGNGAGPGQVASQPCPNNQ